jgi:hypothetical protein
MSISPDAIEEMDVEDLPNYETREAKGDFSGMTDDEVRQIYIEEHLDDIHESKQRLLDQPEVTEMTDDD